MHVRVNLVSIEDKNRLLRNKKFLKGTQIYLDEDLTIEQQEERCKEWERVKATRNKGKWAWLQNGKAQVSDIITHQK